MQIVKQLRIESGHPVTSDAAPVPGDRVRFMTPDGRCMFEVRVGDDGRSIEVHGVETARVDGVLYSETLLVQPCAWNSVNITTKEYGK